MRPAAFLILAFHLAEIAAPVVPHPAPPPVDAEIRCTDDSTIKLKILDETVTLTTRYGPLTIPLSEVRRIEFATRTTSADSERIDLLIKNMAHPDPDSRDKASAELREFREKAYLPALKATKHTDPEIGRRAAEIAQHLSKLPSYRLESHASDIIYTDDSKFVGQLSGDTIKVRTTQFGEQSLRLADIRTLRTAGGPTADDLAGAIMAPASMSAYANQIGKELLLSVPGTQVVAPVWGTDVYTLDSNVTSAAVHAGLVTLGQPGTVRVRIVASPVNFGGTSRNGITSAPYGNYPAGAFEFIRK